MRKTILCVAAMMALQFCMAQSNEETAHTVRQLKVTPLAPGFEVELPIFSQIISQLSLIKTKRNTLAYR
jgi:hypothetical protein